MMKRTLFLLIAMVMVEASVSWSDAPSGEQPQVGSGSGFGPDSGSSSANELTELDVSPSDQTETEAIPTAPAPTTSPSPASTCTLQLPTHSDVAAHQADGDFEAFTDCNHLVEVDQHPSINVGAGNGVLYTAEKYAFYSEFHWITEEDRDEFARIVRSLQAAPGLINRNPPDGFHNDQDGADDYVGLAAAAHMIGRQAIANEIWDYGNRHLWNYNNVDPNGSINEHSFINRPWWVAHFSHCAGQAADAISETAWGAKMAAGGGRGNPGEIALEWFMMHCLPERAGATAKAGAALWIRHFRKNWPGGMKQVMAAYFATTPSHPLILYAPTFDTFHAYDGLLGVLKSIAMLLINEGVSLVNSSIRDARKLALASEAQAVAAAKVLRENFTSLEKKAGSAATRVKDELTNTAAKVDPIQLGRNLERAVQHDIDIIVKVGPKFPKLSVPTPAPPKPPPLPNPGPVAKKVCKWVKFCK